MYLAAKSIGAIVILALGSSITIGAEPPHSCENANFLIEKVFTCGENAIAAQKAEDCRQRVMSNWIRESNSLTNLMEKQRNRVEDSQSNFLLEISTNLSSSIKALDDEIESMTKNRDLVATYPPILLKYFPGISNPSDPQCYSRSRRKIMGVIESLSKEIKTAKALRAKAQNFLVITQGRSDGLKNKILLSPLPENTSNSNSGTPSIPEAPYSPGRGKSDISGTDEKKEKTKKQSLNIN